MFEALAAAPSLNLNIFSHVTTTMRAAVANWAMNCISNINYSFVIPIPFKILSTCAIVTTLTPPSSREDRVDTLANICHNPQTEREREAASGSLKSYCPFNGIPLLFEFLIPPSN